MVAALFSAALGLVGAGACSGDGATGTASTGSSSTGSSSGGAGGVGSTGTLGGSCQPACTAPQFCASDGTCLDPGHCHADADCGTMGLVCDVPTSTCVPGGGCGSKESKTTPIPPNLLVVLDRSCSMTEKIGNQTKWQIAVAALNGLMTTYSGQIRFGITLFPDRVTPSCAQDMIPVHPGPGNETTIQGMLTSSLTNGDPLFPNGPCVTNIDTAILQAQGEPALMDPARKSYVLLLTDGKQAGCNLGGGDNGTTAAITAMHAAGVDTFVIGFGSGADPVSLTAFADAGGVPAMGAHHYYDAADQASLAAALDTIANATIGCDYKLTDVPPDPSKVYVFFDNASVPSGAPDGWTYDPATNTITFLGAACQQIKSGSVMDVHVVYGCNMIPPN
jgi:hypothetical protein